MFLVEYDEASAYAEENSLLFMETSAKTAVSVVCGVTISEDPVDD